MATSAWGAPTRRRIEPCSSGSRSRVTTSVPPVAAGPEPPAIPTGLLAFVSLSRLASGEGSVADVLALGSRLLGDIVPGVTGAWFVPDTARDRLVVNEAFGPAAHALRGVHVGMGERLTGWVAAQRQPIVNSDAALDIGDRVDAVTPPLLTCMSVPIVAGDTLVAVLSLYAPTADTFDEDRGRLIQMVAPHVAGAIQAAAGRASSSALDRGAATRANRCDAPPPGRAITAAPTGASLDLLQQRL